MKRRRLIPFPSLGRRPRCLPVFFALAATAVAIGVLPVNLLVRATPDEIGVSAPNLHFLTGKALDHLHDGAAVAFDARLSLYASSRPEPVERSFERFVVSYDLWEEKFSVARLENAGEAVSHLSAGAAEAWCLEGLHVARAKAPAGLPLRLRLELRTEEPGETNPLLGDSGISLSRLIEVFSRPPRVEQQKWTLESAVFRLGNVTPAAR